MEEIIGKSLGVIIVVGGALLWALSFAWPFLLLGGIGCWLRRNKTGSEKVTKRAKDAEEKARVARVAELKAARERILAERAWLAGAD